MNCGVLVTKTKLCVWDNFGIVYDRVYFLRTSFLRTSEEKDKRLIGLYIEGRLGVN